MAMTQAPTRRRARTQRQLLDAAAVVIARDGYEKASLADIAAEAGLTTGAVYSAFGSKWELLRAVVADRVSVFSLAPGALDDTVDEQAAGLHGAVAQDEARQVLILQLESLLLALHDPDSGLLDQFIAEGRENRARLARQLRAAAKSEKRALPFKPEHAATLTLATILGLQLTQLFDPSMVPESLYAAALRLCIHGE